MIQADTVTLLWPTDSHPAVVPGKWKRLGLRIQADYHRDDETDELFWAVVCTCLEERLEQLIEGEQQWI